MPFNGFTQEDYAQKMIDEYKAAGVPPEDVWPQSFLLSDVLYWIEAEPEFGAQAVYLDDRYEVPEPTEGSDGQVIDPMDPATFEPGMQELADMGVRTIAPPMWMLVTMGEGGEIVPSPYAEAARAAGARRHRLVDGALGAALGGRRRLVLAVGRGGGPRARRRARLRDDRRARAGRGRRRHLLGLARDGEPLRVLHGARLTPSMRVNLPRAGAAGRRPHSCVSTRSPMLRPIPALSLCAASLALATEARADCAVTAFGFVVCTGTDADGLADATEGLTVEIRPGATVGSAGPIDEAIVLGEGARVLNQGTVDSGGDAVAGGGGLSVENDGSILSLDGAGVGGGDDSSLANLEGAAIQATQDAVRFGLGAFVANDGGIDSGEGDGVVVEGGTVLNAGAIRALAGTGVVLGAGEPGGETLLDNSGLVSGAVGVAAGEGSQTVFNEGAIAGGSGTAIDLGDGSDLVVSVLGGEIDGATLAGAGRRRAAVPHRPGRHGERGLRPLRRRRGLRQGAVQQLHHRRAERRGGGGRLPRLADGGCDEPHSDAHGLRELHLRRRHLERR